MPRKPKGSGGPGVIKPTVVPSAESVASLPPLSAVWSYSSDSDEPPYVPYPTNIQSASSASPMNISSASTSSGVNQNKSTNRNNPAHPLHPQHNQYTATAAANATAPSKGVASKPPDHAKSDEKAKMKEQLLKDPEMLARALELQEKKKTAERARKKEREVRNTHLSESSRSEGGGRIGRKRRIREGDGAGFEEESEDGVGFDVAHTLGCFTFRRRTMCLYLLVATVFGSGLSTLSVFTSVADTAFSFPKLYYTAAVLGVLFIIASIVGLAGAYTNSVDILYAFVGLITTLAVVGGVVGALGLVESESAVIAAASARSAPAPPQASEIDTYLQNAKSISASVLSTVAAVAVCCFFFFRFRRVLFNERRANIEKTHRTTSFQLMPQTPDVHPHAGEVSIEIQQSPLPEIGGPGDSLATSGHAAAALESEFAAGIVTSAISTIIDDEAGAPRAVTTEMATINSPDKSAKRQQDRLSKPVAVAKANKTSATRPEEDDDIIDHVGKNGANAEQLPV